MRLLVTGGAGFIGLNFIEYMLRTHSDVNIICLDALTYAADEKAVREFEKQSNFTFIRGDIRDKAFVFSLFEKYNLDAVVNFAAESHVDRSIESADNFMTTNILGTQVLLDACREFGGVRFHQISTAEVYGDLPLDSDECFTENSPLKPSSPYSASKASADLLVLSYHRTYSLPVTISRSSNNYGPHQHNEKLIPLMTEKAFHGEHLPVYGNGLNRRDWIHVTDHCRAVDMILHKGKVGEIYNVSSETEVSNLEVVKKLLSSLGKSEDLISFVKDRPGHDLRYAVDSSKIKSELGWLPQVDFEKGLAETVEWYIKKLSE